MTLKICIEESAQEPFSSNGIIVIEKDGKRFYCFVKGTGDKRFPFELVPLTLAQCKKLGIEETFHNNDPSDFETSVEESVQDDPKKKHMDADLTKPEDREKLKKLLEKSEKVFGEDSEKAELEAENADLKEKMALVAEVAFQKKKRELNAPDSITTIEALKAYEEGLKQKENAGSAPLNDFQLHGAQGAKETFSSYEELVKALYAAKTPQAEAVINKLWEKTVQQLKSGQPVVLTAEQQTEPKGNAGVVQSVVDPEGRETEVSELERLGVKKKKNRKIHGEWGKPDPTKNYNSGSGQA